MVIELSIQKLNIKNEVMRNVNVFTNSSPDGHVTVKSAKAVEAETIGQYHPAMRVKIQFSVDDIEEAIKVDNPYFGVRNGTLPLLKILMIREILQE